MIKEHKQLGLENQVDIPDAFPGEKAFLKSSNILRIDKTLNIKDFHKLGDKEFETKKGQKFGRTEFSTLVFGSVYSAATSDFLIGITSLSYAPYVGLPEPSIVGPGKHYIVKDEVGGAASTTITITSEGGKTIDGASSAIITSNYGSKEFYTNGDNWFTK